MSVGPTDGVGSVNSTSWDEPTYPPGLIDEFSGHINNSLRSAPTDTTKLPHYAFNEYSSTQVDAGGSANKVKLPPPTDMIPLGGRLLRGARGGPILMLMQATRYIEFHVDGIEGRPDLSARHIQDGLDGFWGSDRLDIFDASKRQLTSLPLEKADKGSNIKDADGRIVGHLGLTQDDPPKIMAKISPEVLEQFPLPSTIGEAPKTDWVPKTDTVGADPTVKPDANPQVPTEQKSYGFETKTQEEADLVTSMMAQGKSQNEIQVALDDLRSKKGSVSNRIQIALQLMNPEKRLEGQVAQALIDAGINVVGFNEKFGPNGSLGEIDIETPRTIIEVTVAPARKLRQIAKLSSDPHLNPDGKTVILFAPNYGVKAGKDIINHGSSLVRELKELIRLTISLERK